MSPDRIASRTAIAAIAADEQPTMVSLDSDSNLDRVQRVEGYKVLPPCVLYGKIGQGGMGAVYRGRHLNLDIDVAVKCLKPDLTGEDEQFVVRFRREARSAARINHQNVVRVFDVSEDQGLHYIVMELVQGETARQRVQRKQQLSVGEALEILHGATQGLGEAHGKGFIHRDIKPDNIMISQTGQVKVADLGLAKPAGNMAASMLSGTNVVMGTPQYMPPEQWENTVTVTPAADVWALGATLYYLLVGGEAIAKDSLPRVMQRIVLQPFPDLREQRPDVPDDVAALIAKATAKDPADRYADARELGDAIERLETRRESLRDLEASSDGEQNTLVSPPPAKTLAKIKFWLDENQQGAIAASPTERPQDGAQAGSGTMAMAPPKGAAAGSSRTLWMALAGVAALALVLLLWRPWQATDPLAEAVRLERAGQHEAAIREVERVQREVSTLPSQDERLARLHLQVARQQLEQERLAAALEQLAQSVSLRRTPAAERLQREALATAALRIDTALERLAPTTPVEPKQPVVFRGRLADPLVAALTLAGKRVAVAVDTTFEATLDAGVRSPVAVAAELTTGDVVELSAWAFAYRQAQATPANNERPISSTTKPAKAPEQTAANDQKPVVGPDQTQPAAAQALRFVRTPAFVGLQQRERRWVTASDRVEIRGQLNAVGCRLMLAGSPIADVRWDEGEFTAAISQLAIGENRLRLLAEREGTTSVSADLVVYRLGAPALTPAEATQSEARVQTAALEVAFVGDQWTRRIEAINGERTVRLRRDRDGRVYRGRVPLAVGANVVVVRAIDVLGQEAQLELRLERLPSSAKPSLDSLQLPIAGELVEVGVGSQVWLRDAAALVVGSSDPDARVLINDEPVERGEGGGVSIEPWLVEGKRPTPIEVVLENDAGRTRPFRFFVWFDRTLPSVVWQELPGAVPAGKPFVLRGTWEDAGTLQVDGCKLGELAVRLSPRGAAPRGTWRVRHPGLEATSDLELVVTDRAGNQQRLTLRVEVQ